MPADPPPCLFVFFGLIASGKSTLADAFASGRGIACFNSDRVRKELAGFLATSREHVGFHQGIYTPEFSRRTYDELLVLAGRELATGKSAVLDASFHSAVERELVCKFAAAASARIFFILCQCSETETINRLEKRGRDVHAISDGRWEIFVTQRQRFEAPKEVPPKSLIIINTEKDVKDLLMDLEQQLSSSPT